MITLFEAIDQRGHRSENGHSGLGPQRLGRTIAPFDQYDGKSRCASGGDIYRRVSAIEGIIGRASQSRKRHVCSVGSGLAGASGRTADNRAKVPRKAELRQNPVAQALGFVRADRERGALCNKGAKRLGNTGKRQVRRDRDCPVEAPEFRDLGGRVQRVGAQHGSNHRFAANGVHAADHGRVGPIRCAAVVKHLVNDGCGKTRAVDQGAIEIENDVTQMHEMITLNQDCLGPQGAF